MKSMLLLCCVLILDFMCSKHTTRISYPEKFEGLTQLILASETKTISFTDTTIQKILGFKIGSAQIKVTASVTFDFYLDFEKDGYSMKFSETADTLFFNAPPLRVKKPMINNTNVDYPEKSFLVNEQEAAVKKLEKLTDEFIGEGEILITKDYVKDKCIEMLTLYMIDLCNKMKYNVKNVIIIFPPDNNV